MFIFAQAFPQQNILDKYQIMYLYKNIFLNLFFTHIQYCFGWYKKKTHHNNELLFTYGSYFDLMHLVAGFINKE